MALSNLIIPVTKGYGLAKSRKLNQAESIVVELAKANHSVKKNNLYCSRQNIIMCDKSYGKPICAILLPKTVISGTMNQIYSHQSSQSGAFLMHLPLK